MYEVSAIPSGVRQETCLKPRVTIVGGGLAGTSLAYLLDGDFDVVLLEAKRKPGGHIDCLEAEIDGRVRKLDLGAQFASPETHPHYFDLLEELDFTFGAMEQHPFFSRPADMTFFKRGRSRPEFITPLFYSKLWPLLRSWNYKGITAFSALRKAARKLKSSGDPDPGRTIGDWMASIPGVSEKMRELATGLFAAMNGTSLVDTTNLSLQEGAFFFVHNLQDNPLATIEYYFCKYGLEEVLQRMILRFTTVEVRCGEKVTGLYWRPDGSISVKTRGNTVTSDYVVMACPPYASVKILEDNPDAADRLRELKRFTYFRSRIVLHRDPCYMPPNPKHWSIYTTEMTDSHCEASIWYNNILRTSTPLFKSWATSRPVEPADLLAEREFLHPVIDTEFVRAQRALKSLQGRGNLYFAGSYTHSVDSQETAYRSARFVSRMLHQQAETTGKMQEHPG